MFRNNPHIKTILISAATSALVLGAALAALSGYVYINRGDIFNYFAEKFISDNKNVPISDRGSKKENIKTSQNFEKKLARALVTQEDRVISAVDKAIPAVFSIVITKDVPVVEKYFDPFFDFFGDGFGGFQVPRYKQRGTEERQVGSGSGFLISPDGLAVTNKHVVNDDQASYTAFTNEGKKYDIEVVDKDPVLDIAVIRLKEAKKMPFLSFDTSDIKIGQSVIAIGNALGKFKNSVSVGVVSGVSRSIVAGDGLGKSEFLNDVIQTDAAINPGNSGGPLINLNGMVVGINVAVAGAAENIGFTLPAKSVKDVVDSVKEHGRIVRAFLGVRYVMINERIKNTNKLSVDYGALIIRGSSQEELAVMPGSPADKAGIVENDIILEIDGEKLTEDTSLAAIIRRKKVGQTVRIKLLSKGEEKEITAKLEEMSQ